MTELHQKHTIPGTCCCCRREFLQSVGAATGSLSLLAGSALAASDQPAATGPAESVAVVRGAFIYPPSATLREAGYWSWPGSSFDPESHQKKYSATITQIAQQLNMRIAMDAAPLDTEQDVTRFIEQVKQDPPDGLLLVPFKKGHWPRVMRIVDEVKIPTVVLATLGVLLVNHIRQLRQRPGVYLISSMDDLDAVREGMNMIRAARAMRDARIVNIAGSKTNEAQVPHLHTRVRTLPLTRFYDEYRGTKVTPPVERLAREYLSNAKEIIEPTRADIRNAARTYFALKQIVEAEKADALMMDCLPGLRRPHKHVPPCMGFMSLRDEGTPIGCQSDLNATVTLLLVQRLFGKPGFQQNAAMDTENNRYFGAHCTSPSRMNGPDAPAEPYILRSHAEAGWGCVPQVLFPKGQDVTMALYQVGEKPRMLVYTGDVACCYPKAAGGCRTNVALNIHEVDDVCDVQGMHQIIFYGQHGRQLREFCQLLNIEVVS